MSRPTPTPEEQARHAKGERLSVHAYDGSPLQPGAHPPGDPAREAKPEEPVSAVELTQHKPIEFVAEPAAEEPEKLREEKATAAETHRATYRTRRAKADDDEKKD